MLIALTGAAGFIGSHLTELLVRKGHHVVALDSFDSYLYPAEVKERNAAELEQLPRARFQLQRGDVRDPEAVARLISSEVDVVCHLAALAGVRPSLADPIRYVRTNVEGTNVVLERMRAVGLRKLVFASSSSVYGAKPSVDAAAFHEDEPCLVPVSPYAATKRMNELQLATYAALYGIGSFALRFFTVYGPRQRPDMAIHKFTKSIAHGESITLFGDGSSRRDYTYVDDIIAGTVSAIERVMPSKMEIINLGGTSTISLRDLIGVIENTVGASARVEWAPDQPGDVPVTYANIDKARALLGYEPITSISAGIAHFWDWLKQA